MAGRTSLVLIISVMAIALIGCGTAAPSAEPTSTSVSATAEQAAAESTESPGTLPTQTSLAADATAKPAATPVAAPEAQAPVSTPIATPTGAEPPIAASVPPTQIAGNTGMLEVRVTDAPPDAVTKIDVTISRLQVHRAGAGVDQGWIEVFSTSTTFDLVELTGVEQVLSTGLFPAGKYTQIRMDVVSVEVTYMVGGATTTAAARVPSDKLKVVGGFVVEAGGATTTVLVLDFDAAKSVVLTGQGKVLFKPVVKLLKRKRGGGLGAQGQGQGGQGGQQGGDAGDTTPPVITITGVSDGATSTDPFTPEFGASDDVDPPENITVAATLNGAAFASGTQVAGVGSYTLVVTATDSSGNEAEAEVEFEIAEP